MATYNIENAPKNLTMLDFYSYSSVYGSLAKSSRFAIRILPSGSDNYLQQSGYGSFMQQFTYLCESAEMPGRGFMNVDLRYYGPSFKLPYQTEYQETAMTFICRNRSIERQFFDDWMEIINPTNTFDFNYRDNYKCEIQIYQFSDTMPNTYNAETPTAPEAQYCWTLHDAYPLLVNPQPVTWADDNFQRLAINFTYTRWTRKGKDRDPARFSVDPTKSQNIPVPPATGSSGSGYTGGGRGGGGGSGW